MTTTTKELEAVFEILKDRAVVAGVTEAKDWKLATGSKTYGNAFRIWLDKSDGTGAHYTPKVDDYLGMTKAEAVSTMRAMASAFRAVTWSQAGA